jgi:hypothetical protein
MCRCGAQKASKVPENVWTGTGLCTLNAEALEEIKILAIGIITFLSRRKSNCIPVSLS